MLVSIITVSYQSAKTIASTLESVWRQTHPDIDYWVIDGASTDGTLDIIHQWEPRFGGRLHYVSEPDGGIYEAMNKGVALCRGDVVGILNSDDFFTTDDVVARVVARFEADAHLQALYGDVHFVNPTDTQRCVRYYSGRLFRPWMMRLGFMPPHPSLYVRSQVYRQYGDYLPQYRISADYDFMARIFCIHRLPHAYLHLDIVTMRNGGASTDSMRSRLQGTHEDLLICRRLGIRTNWVLIFCKYILKTLSMFIR